MQNRLVITFEGDHIQVVSDGEKDFEFQERVWTEVVAACRQHNCFKVLGIANSTVPIEALDGYDLARLFRELGITHEYRIAWVECDAEARDVINFIETVLVNRGLPGRVFEDVDEARRWLLGDETTKADQFS